jgi:hypothetical protein
MKKLFSWISFVVLIVVWLKISVWAYEPADYYRCTRDAPVIQALQILEYSSDKAAVDTIMDTGVRIMFKNMLEFGKLYQNNDALSIISNDGRHLIFINKKHYSAPPQALAATISHEVMHSDRENSIAEEFAAWTQEGKTWQEMLKRYPELQSIPVKTYPLVDRLNAIVLLIDHHQLEAEIRNNPVYKGLPEHSPGF